MGKLVKGVAKVFKKIVGIVSKVVGGIFGFAVGGSNKSNKTAPSGGNLNKSLEPEAYRKIVLGNIAAPLDVRFWQVFGNKGGNFDEVIALASHQINAVKELWFEDVLGITAAGASTGKYTGVVTREIRLGLNTQTALNVGGATQYDAAAKFEGCAVMALKWLPDEKKLPDGIPSRYTQIVEGALVYDPRRDSTQLGGAGTHRANDRSTWTYATLDPNGIPIGRNNALQALWYLLGWVIPTKDAVGVVTGEMLVCGRGINPQDINMASFITGANNCEVAGYYTDVTLSTGDDHTINEDKITCDGLIGRLIDPGGLWSYYANVNDTANIAVELTDDDILEGSTLQWNEFKGMSEQYNQVGGKFVNPSNITLFQPFPYPLVRDATYEANLGVKRRKVVDFEQVLDSTLAQRLARLFLNQGQYQGELSSGFLPRAIKAQAWSVVRYTSERFGWTKLFRVWRHEIDTNGSVSMLLKEIHASIWGAGTVTPVAATATGTPFDPLQQINATGVTVALEPITGASGTLADGFRISWTAPPAMTSRTEIRFRLVGTVTWATAGPVERDVMSVLVGPLLSGAIYEVAVRHISVNEIAGLWVVPTVAPANASGQFALGTTGNVNYSAISAAGGTALWSNIVGQLNAPTNNANRTQDNIANSFLGRGDLASLNAVTLGTPQTLGFGGFAGRSALGWDEASFTGRPIWATDTEDVVGIPRLRASRIGYNLGSGGYLSERWPQEALANITENRVANTFLGRGDFASMSAIGWGDSRITGRSAAITNFRPDGRLIADNVQYLNQASGSINDLQPAEINANITENRIANSFVGRGDLASLNNVDFESTRVTNKTRTSRLNSTSGYAAQNFAGNDGRTFSKIFETNSSRDGDVISFGSTLPSVPNINFLPGGNASTAGQNVQIVAVGVTVSGFTMKAKSQAVTAGATITDITAVTPGAGEPTKIIDRSNGSAPFDGKFTFNIAVTVGNVAAGEPGSIAVGIFVRQGGAWVQVGIGVRTSTGNMVVDVVPGTVDFGAGGEFGASVVMAEGTGTVLNGINSVVYTLGTVTETSLTPVGASDIPWLGLLQ